MISCLSLNYIHYCNHLGLNFSSRKAIRFMASSVVHPVSTLDDYSISTKINTNVRTYFPLQNQLFNSWKIGPNKFHLHYGDLSDSTNLVYIIHQVQPSEVYNLGAQSHVKVSFEMAEYTVSTFLPGSTFLTGHAG